MDGFIDCRSDTLTLPTQEMRNVIFNAKVGDQGYAEDEITISLEKYCAEYFGKEDALFMCSGTMADQVSLRTWTKSGDEVIIDSSYHINYFQAGPSTDLAKILLTTCSTVDGIIHVDDIERAIRARIRGPLFNKPGLISLENTINGHGGAIFPLDALKEIYTYANQLKIPVHIDGERFLNACVATGITAKEYARYTDSITTSFSKGLGAPFGSILMGSKEFIQKAKKYRRWYGGSLHQSGFMAAAALYAIKNNVNRLSIDHENARLLYSLLNKDIPTNIKLNPVETNMVTFSVKNLNMSAYDFTERCREMRVLLYPWSEYTVRAVFSSNINSNEIYTIANVILEVCANFRLKALRDCTIS
jgi:threonine aldolase